MLAIWTKAAAVLAIAIATASCAVFPSATPTRSQLEDADFGPEPSVEEAESIATEYLDAVLKDPGSKIVSFGDIERRWYHIGWRWSPHRYAWGLPATVNAKNSYGGYTGAQGWIFYFRGQLIVAVATPVLDYPNATSGVPGGPTYGYQIESFPGADGSLDGVEPEGGLGER